ncbi:MAG: AAA family ATPase [Armatimonadota bacterium]|nr:AAA family ATPase [Armatimonadota bacterium]
MKNRELATQRERTEKALIGLMVDSRKVLEHAVHELKASDFCSPVHSDVFNCLRKLHNNLEPGQEPSLGKLLEIIAESDCEIPDAERFLHDCNDVCVSLGYTVIDAENLISSVKKHSLRAEAERQAMLMLNRISKGDEDPRDVLSEFLATSEELLKQHNGHQAPEIRWAEDVTAWETEWLIPGLLPRRGIVILAGKPGAGKTTLCAYLVWHVATGESLWGKTVEQGRILWLGFDDPFERIRAEKLELLGYFPARTICTVGDLRPLNEKTFASYVALCREHGIKLVVADTLLDFVEVPGDKIDSSGPVQRAMQTLRRFEQEANVCVVGTWHPNKDELRWGVSRLANSTQLAARADVVLLLEQHVVENRLCTLEFAKDRLGNAQGMKMTLTKSNGLFEPTQESPKPQTLKESIYKVLCERGKMTRDDIIHCFSDSASVRAIDKALQQLTGRDDATEPLVGVVYDKKRRATYFPLHKGSKGTTSSVSSTELMRIYPFQGEFS